jgi:hypothetical protein
MHNNRRKILPNILQLDITQGAIYVVPPKIKKTKCVYHEPFRERKLLS